MLIYSGFSRLNRRKKHQICTGQYIEILICICYNADRLIGVSYSIRSNKQKPRRCDLRGFLFLLSVTSLGEATERLWHSYFLSSIFLFRSIIFHPSYSGRLASANHRSAPAQTLQAQAPSSFQRQSAANYVLRRQILCCAKIPSGSWRFYYY